MAQDPTQGPTEREVERHTTVTRSGGAGWLVAGAVIVAALVGLWLIFGMPYNDTQQVTLDTQPAPEAPEAQEAPEAPPAPDATPDTSPTPPAPAPDASPEESEQPAQR